MVRGGGGWLVGVGRARAEIGAMNKVTDVAV